MDAADVESDLVEVLYTEAQIQERLRELAQQIEACLLYTSDAADE